MTPAKKKRKRERDRNRRVEALVAPGIPEPCRCPGQLVWEDMVCAKCGRTKQQ